MTKVILINGSPKPEGNTALALQEVAKMLNSKNIETEIIHIGHLPIRGCMACGKCAELSRCVIDDTVNEVANKLRQADGLVLGTPVYYASPNGTLISLLDRLFYSMPDDLSTKVGASLAVARRGGCSAALEVLDKYFAINNMSIVTSQYWNMAHGRLPGEVVQDLEGMQTMRRLGINMAFLIQSIALGKEQMGMPILDEQRTPTNFIR